MVQQVYLCLLLQGDSYSFKEAIVLAEYKVDVSSVVRDGARRTDRVCIVSLLHIFSIFSQIGYVLSPFYIFLVYSLPFLKFTVLSPF